MGDKNGDGVANDEIVKYSNLSSKTINSEWTKYNRDSQWSYYNKESMIYNVHVVAKDALGNTSQASQDVNQEICLNSRTDHKTSHWGNVKMEEDGSYFVWVPRYAYKITPAPSTEESETNAGTIDVKFINGTGNTAYDGTECTIATSNEDKTPNNIDSTTQYIVHPAFCTDVNMGGYGENLEGIWVAKYESSREDSADGSTWEATTDSKGGSDNLTTNAGNTSTTQIRVVSKPNVTSWRYIQIQSMYCNGYNYNRSLDSHMMKNSEWRSSGVLNA